MKKTLLIFFLITNIYANEYFSKAEPIWRYKIKSDVRGKVIFSDETKEGKYADGNIIIKIDDAIDLIDLETTKKEYNYLKETIQISKEIYELDKKAYEKIKNLSTYSRNQKDSKHIKMLNSKKTLLNQQTNLAKLNLKIETLKDKISKKNIKVKQKYYITTVYPKKGDYVTLGSPLLDIADLSAARLTIFVTADDLDKINNSDILINGKKQKYKIVKILKIADSKNLSGYKVELEIEPPKIFSKLVKVEIR